MTLFKHQIAAVERYVHQSVIPLLFGVGSGKTLTATAIAVAKYKLGPQDPDYVDAVLVIAPNLVEKQWALQELPKYFEECFGDVDAYVYWNKKEQRPVPFHENRLNFCCVNIDAFSQPSKWQRYVNWANSHNTMVIVDEATRIKNRKAKRTERIMYSFADVTRRGKTIKSWKPIAKARCILTGTPITRGPTDVWSMYEFLEHDYFKRGEYSFQARYTMMAMLMDPQGRPMAVGGRPIRVPLSEAMWQRIRQTPDYDTAHAMFGVDLDSYSLILQQDKYQGAYKNIDELLSFINKHSMTVRTEDVTELPDRVYDVKTVSMTDSQKMLYKDLREEMIALYEGKETTASTKMVLMIRLNQISSGFITSQDYEPQRDEYGTEEAYQQALADYLKDPPPREVTWLDKNPKAELLLNDMEELYGEKVIVVCAFVAEADMLYEALKKAGHTVCLMTGHRKVGTIEGFQGTEYDVLVANERVISTGLNLQCCHRMLFYNNTYSLEDRIQVEGRINRTGQTEKCFYTDYIVSDSVDLKILANLRMKRQLSDYVKNKSAEQTIASIPNEQKVIEWLCARDKTNSVDVETEKVWLDSEVDF